MRLAKNARKLKLLKWHLHIISDLRVDEFFNNKKSTSAMVRDATTGYIMFGLGFGVKPTNALNSANGIPKEGYLNGGDIFMNNLLQKDGWK